MISPALFEQLVGEIGAEIASRVAAELASRLPADRIEEPWRLLDVGEAAERLGRSTRWVRDRVKRGDLGYVRLDRGALAFELEELQRFAEARRVGGPLAGRLHAVRDAASAAGSRTGDQVTDRMVRRV